MDGAAGRLPSMGSQRVGHDWVISLSLKVCLFVFPLMGKAEWGDNPVCCWLGLYFCFVSYLDEVFCRGSDTTEWLHFHFSLSRFGERDGNALQCSCLENPGDGGAWWAPVYGVAQSRTRLKWLSSSSSRLLCPWDSPGKNTGVSCLALLHGIFLT